MFPNAAQITSGTTADLLASSLPERVLWNSAMRQMPGVHAMGSLAPPRRIRTATERSSRVEASRSEKSPERFARISEDFPR